jgi:CHAT domain-containing protein
LTRGFSSVTRGDGSLQPLPGTKREALALQASVPGAVLRTGINAQETSAKLQAGGFRLLHFATHGLFNDAAPLLSSIVLAQPNASSPDDGFLTAREIFELDLGADMAVLSACNTARGEQRNGEGVIGLTWALFVAGVPSDVVSQWAVNDDSTALLMAEFYRDIARGEDKSTALRTASLSLLRSKDHSHPYYWAPFILLGDWRK